MASSIPSVLRPISVVALRKNDAWSEPACSSGSNASAARNVAPLWPSYRLTPALFFLIAARPSAISRFPGRWLLPPTAQIKRSQSWAGIAILFNRHSTILTIVNLLPPGSLPRFSREFPSLQMLGKPLQMKAGARAGLGAVRDPTRALLAIFNLFSQLWE